MFEVNGKPVTPRSVVQVDEKPYKYKALLIGWKTGYEGERVLVRPFRVDGTTSPGYQVSVPVADIVDVIEEGVSA